MENKNIDRRFLYSNGFTKRIYICNHCGSYKLKQNIKGGMTPSDYTCTVCNQTSYSPVWEDISPSFETLQTVLKGVGLFSKDIKIRLKNKQIKVNGEVATGKEEFDINPDDYVIDCGTFIFNLIMKNPIWGTYLLLVDLETYFDPESNIKNSLTEYLKDYSLLSVSKKQKYIIKHDTYENY